MFRYVGFLDEGETVVVQDTLSCLDRARPPESWDTLRVLDDDVGQGAFGAWEVARDHIVQRWNWLSDPANVAPKIPAVMRRSAQVLREHATHLSVDQLDRAVQSVEAPYAERILRLFRSALSVSDPSDQVAGVLSVLEDLGLEPPPEPEPLPEITRDDVHLVCWLALVLPEGASAPEQAPILADLVPPAPSLPGFEAGQMELGEVMP